MSPTMTDDDRRFVERIAERLQQESRRICGDWLYQLSQLLPVGPNELLPSEDLLDHIPALLAAVSAELVRPETADVKASSTVIEKAKALGNLRYSQNASVHQILREYDILATLLAEFVVRETASSSLHPSPTACFSLLSRLNRAIRILMQTTVDTFIERYVETIALHQQRLADFNRVVSHELRNPMNTLQVAAELLANCAATDTDRQRRLVTMVQAAVKQMRQLLEGVEKLSSGNARAQTASASVQEVDVGSIARDVAKQLEDMAKARQMEVRIAEDLPTLSVDLAKLEMILVNLIANAIKYSDSSKNVRYVEIGSEGSSSDLYTIFVRDNGIGIPSQFIDRIFERFYRAHDSRDGELGIEGSGLGLSIVKECVRDMGGSIEVESVEKEWTRFRLRLPAKPPA
jgi:signal transduction histidine kinase